ncbi:kinase inhibitor, partial [Cronobacter sakazakii]
MNLISVIFKEGDRPPAPHVFSGMVYGGDNIPPHLPWEGVPPGTKSFGVTCSDPAAPPGPGGWRGVVANRPADTR